MQIRFRNDGNFCLFGEESLFRAIDLHSEQIENFHLIPASWKEICDATVRKIHEEVQHRELSFSCIWLLIALYRPLTFYVIVCQNMECKFKIPID